MKNENAFEKERAQSQRCSPIAAIGILYALYAIFFK